MPSLLLRLTQGLAALAAGSYASLSLAQTVATPSEDAPLLDPIVVTATRVAQPLTQVLADVSTIHREQLESSGLQSLLDVLSFLPGVQISANGSYRSSSSLFLRGASASQSLLLVNGARMGSATAGSFSLESLPVDRIERIEVLRGAAAAMYGADAVGGVIQIFTREPKDGFHPSASLGLGSDGQRKASAQLQGQAGLWSYSLGATRERGDGQNVKTAEAAGFNADDDGFGYTSADATLRFQPTSDHTLTATIMHSKGEYGFDGTPFPNPLRLTAANSTALAQSTLKQLGLTWDAHWSANWTSKLSVSRTEDSSVSQYYRQTDRAFGGASRFDTTRQQLSWQNELSWDKSRLTLLAEHSREHVDSTVNYPVKHRVIDSVMASYAQRGDLWDALVTVRYDKNSQFGSVTSWALSGGYRFNDVWRLVGSVGTTFQAPSFNQLYYPEFGNATLTPQRGRSQELGLRYHSGNTRAGMTVYQNKIAGFITPATNEQSERAELKGVTLNWEQRWGPTSLTASYDYTRAHLRPSDLPLPRRANHVLQARLTHEVAGWQPFAEIKWVSHREDSRFPGRVTLPGYGVLNVGTRYAINRHWQLQARLNNVLDKKYTHAYGYTTPRRNVFVSLDWKF